MLYLKMLLSCILLIVAGLITHAQTNNTLTDEEKKEGWRLLFDGTTLNNWHTYNKNYLDKDWEVSDGTIHLIDRVKPRNGSGDLTTNEAFDNFDLKLEWKIAANTNSGVMFYVQENTTYQPPFFTGLEMQILDNDGNSLNAKTEKQRAGDLYDLIAGRPGTVKPAGEWNQIEIYSNNGDLKLYQNGVNIITTKLWDENWTNFIASHNATIGRPRPQLGMFRFGKIDLQDANGEIWFRNIKIKTLNAGAEAMSPSPGSNAAGSNGSNVSIPEYTIPRMKAIAGYYGFLNTSYSDVAKSLEPLVAGGDIVAAMWKAVFLYMGRGQYKHDELQAYTIAKSALPKIEALAGKGDAEALYLLFYACQMGLKGENTTNPGNAFLSTAAGSSFIPAVYDNALEAFRNKKYDVALNNFLTLYDRGVKKAAVMIGVMYEGGYGVNKDADSAMAWYQKGIRFGDAEALLCQAEIKASGYNDSPPDPTGAISLATIAAGKNDGEAMLFLGARFVDGKQGVSRNVTTGIKWLKQSAATGNRKAMLVLGTTYLSDLPGNVKDEHTALFWIKKAAENGSPLAMLLLSRLYKEGEVTGQNEIIGRYWYNQAVQAGYAAADATAINATTQSFSDFWNNADFTPSYVLVDEYHDVVGDSGDGFFNGMISGIFGAMSGYYGNRQQLIDGLEYICKKAGKKIYGGTVSSSFISNLYLKQGQTIFIQAYGVISTGMFSGMANADGLGNAWQEYAFVQGIPCSAVMAQVKDDTWKFIGQRKLFTASKDGPLVMALNGKDYQNYKGYFDIVVEVPDN